MRISEQHLKQVTREGILLTLAMILAAAGSGILFYLAGLNQRPDEAFIAFLVVWFPALLVLWIARLRTSRFTALRAVAFLRIGVTIAIAGFAVSKSSSLKTLSFFLTVTVVYLTGLYVEIWLAWKNLQEDGDHRL